MTPANPPRADEAASAPEPPPTPLDVGRPGQSLPRRITRLFRPYRKRLALTALVIIAGAAFGVANPFLIQAILDDALFGPGGPDLPLLGLLVGLMVLFAVLSGAAGVVRVYLTNIMGNRVMHDLRDRLFAHLESLPIAFYTTARTGELQSRLANDIGGIQGVVTAVAPSVLSQVVGFIAAFVAMLILSWQLTLVSLVVVPLFVLLAYRVGRRRRAVTRETQRSLADLSSISQEALSASGILLTKVFARRDDEVARYSRASRDLADLQVRQQMTGEVAFAFIQIFFSMAPALAYLIAGVAIDQNFGPQLSAGTIVAFTAVQARIFFPIMGMLRESVELQSSLAKFERIFEYFDIESDIVDGPQAVALPRASLRGAVALRDVTFTYPAPFRFAAAGPDTSAGAAPPPLRPALRDVSLRVEPGQLAALVGPSGAGKSTVSYLIPRLYEASSGHVEIDGRDVRDIQLQSLAEAIGLVTQESYLFHGSVRENLLYARPGAGQDEIEAAARAAFIHDRVLQLEEGYDTLVGERGYRLSGGEKQRLAIARVLLKDPAILILDEATSALDTRSERLVQQALEPLMRDRTTIAIAHRLSTIIAADVIFVLQEGRLAETGTHADLLAAGGLYAELYEHQFQGGLIESRCEDGVVLSSGEIVRTPAA